MGRPAIAIRFVELDEGCLVPLNIRMNQDGYFRKRWSGEAEMFHRFIWRARKGPIPEGFEINHLCGNRACQNVEHFECICGTEHAVKTNQERYTHEKVEARKLWEETECSATALKKLYGWRAYGWVREWKADDQ
jgi:hypothetical protein